MTETVTPICPPDLRAALAPFLYAACAGWMVEQDCREAKPDQQSERPLIGFAGYCGHFAAQSKVSWADWKNLLDAGYRAGFLDQPGTHPVPEVSKGEGEYPEPPLPDVQLANGGACS
jgi:hypothetical protein